MLQPNREGEVHRLFFALWPDAATRVGMADAAARLGYSLGRPVKPHRYHLTPHTSAISRRCRRRAQSQPSRLRPGYGRRPWIWCWIAPVTWPVREFVLIHSQLGARNAYDLLGRWPLPA